MKRKLISFAIAFALVAQTIAFAGTLTTNLGTTKTYEPILVDIVGAVSQVGGTSYASSTTEQNFDYKVSIDMNNVRTEFDKYYTVGSAAAPALGGTLSDFENSSVTGNFTISASYATGMTQATAATKPFTKEELDGQLTAIGSIFTVDSVTYGGGVATVNASVKSGITAKALNDNKATYLQDFDLAISQLNAATAKSHIIVSMSGHVDITESDETTPFARLDFQSSASSTAYAYFVSTGGTSTTTKTEDKDKDKDTDTDTDTDTDKDKDKDSDETIIINEDGTVTVNADGKSKTTKKTEDGVTTTTTTIKDTATDKSDDGSKTETETEVVIVTEADAKTGEVSKSTITETKTVTETAKDGEETTTVTTKETVKETDPETGVTTVETTEATTAAAGKGATVGTTTAQRTVTRKVTVKEAPAEKEGFIENGWSATPYAPSDKNYKGTSEVETTVTETTVTETKVLVDEDGEPILDKDGNEQLETIVTTTSEVALYPKYVNVTVPKALEQEKDKDGNMLHKAYIAGYPDGEIKPNNNITREEITSAFDRLLNVAYRANIETTEQNFPDVESDRWSNNSIATMANGGFIVGDAEGNFNPSQPITRAEFAVIASKFAPADAEPAENYFTDLDGHWAKDFILKVAGQYWISGYADGTFNPDAYITRAEAMTIINRMLVRYGDEEAKNATDWPDVDSKDWYYGQVIEATTNNTYERTENGWSEKWVEE